MSQALKAKIDAELYLYASSVIGIKEIDLSEKDGGFLGADNEFVVPNNIQPLSSNILQRNLPLPHFHDFVNVAPSSIVNVYNAEVPPPIDSDRVFYTSPLPKCVSIVVMSNLRAAINLERRMQKIADLAGKDCVIGVKMILNRSTDLDNCSVHPCLLTEVVPGQTVGQFLAEKPPLPVKREFFKKLWSALSKLHEADNFFGNLTYGLRVVDNKPILTFPARGEICSGMQNDLLHVAQLAIEAFSDLVVELRSFLSICKEVIQPYNFDSIRDGSYWVLHHDLVWAPDDGSRFVLRLHEYCQLDPAVYHLYVDDGAIAGYPYLAVDYDWKGILDNLNGPPQLVRILVTHYKHAISKSNVYDNSESLRYLIRCKLSHLPPWFPVERMIETINEVFPQAMTRLYYMAFRRFHFQSWLKYHQAGLGTMPDFVQFFKFGRGKHNSFQF